MARSALPYEVQWRPKARDDLRAIILYIGADNPVRAAAFGRELRDKTLLLADNPELGRSGRPGVPSYVRELVAHRNYILIYRVRHQAGVVEILRVKHAARHKP